MADGDGPDWLLGGRVHFEQAVQGYRVSIDAVLLAASVTAARGAKVLDVGCGDGGATLCLAWRCPGLGIVGIDLRADALARLESNIAANAMADRVATRCHDLRDGVPRAFDRAFTHVISNPPYLPAERVDLRGRHAADDVANVETVPLGAWLDFMLACAADGAILSVVHRADRLPELLAELTPRTGAITVIPLWPRAGVSAKRVIVHARKGARSPARLSAGLVLHEADGSYTDAARRIFEGGEPLSVS